MTETRERYCPHCGRANPIQMPRCMNCGQRVGGTVLLTEQGGTTGSSGTNGSHWWQTAESGVIPPPPQVREQRERHEAVQREHERRIEEQREFQTRLEEERQRSAERLAAIRERRQARREEGVVPPAGQGPTNALTSCRRCGAPLGQAGHTFSFCLQCGADVQAPTKTTAAASPRPAITVAEDERTQYRPTVRQTSTNSTTVGVTTRTVEPTRSDVNPVVPALLSFLFPGVGQFINGQPTKGVLLLLALFVAMMIFNVNGLILLIGRALAALDAYTIGKRRRDGWPVRDDEWDFGG